jgi:hypothetical protein
MRPGGRWSLHCRRAEGYSLTLAPTLRLSGAYDSVDSVGVGGTDFAVEAGGGGDHGLEAHATPMPRKAGFTLARKPGRCGLHRLGKKQRELLN